MNPITMSIVENSDIENVGNTVLMAIVSVTGVGRIRGLRVRVRFATLARECMIETSVNYTVMFGRF